MKHEFIWGIIIGCLLTILGVIIQQELFTRPNEERKADYQLSVSLCHTLNSRYYLAKNILSNSGSTLFDDRWNIYINQGYTPWVINRNLYKKFLDSKHRDLLEQFGVVDKHLNKLHDLLVTLRHKQGSSDHKLLNAIEGNVKREIEIIASIVEDINTKLYSF